MEIEKKCPICGEKFKVPHWRPNAKCCSKKCLGLYLRAKPNTVCTQCGKEFHMKESQKTRYDRNHGYFCSQKCSSEYKKKVMSGESNHQYGLKGELNASFKGYEIPNKNHNIVDIFVYEPTHPYADKSGRVAKHRLIVEKNHFLFNSDYFVLIDGYYALKKEYNVHHIDGNHNNNDISNLRILTRGEHTSEHNKGMIIKRDNKGRIITVLKKTADIKFEEADELSQTDRGEGGYGSSGR